MTNINKPGKSSIKFEVRAKCQNTSLSENLLKGPNLLSNLVELLVPFRQSKFCIMADIQKLLHQVMVNQWNRDAQRFIVRSIRDRHFRIFKWMFFFWKSRLTCYCIWALNKTRSQNIVKIINCGEKGIRDNFYKDDYLDSFHAIARNYEGVKCYTCPSQRGSPSKSVDIR